jgi:hypothetical protein
VLRKGPVSGHRRLAAFAEYQAFTNRQLPQFKASDRHEVKAGQGSPVQATLALTSYNPALLTELTSRGIAESKARDLLAHLKPGQEVMDQLEYVDSLIARDKKGKIENPPGLYVFYVRDNVTPPADFWSSRKAKLHEESQQAKNAEVARRARLQIDYDEYRHAEIKRFAETLPTEEYQQIFEASRRMNRSVFRSMTDQQMDELTHGTVCGELEKSGRVQLLSFEEFGRSMPT